MRVMVVKHVKMNNITVEKIKKLNQYLDVVLGVPILVA